MPGQNPAGKRNRRRCCSCALRPPLDHASPLQAQHQVVVGGRCACRPMVQVQLECWPGLQWRAAWGNGGQEASRAADLTGSCHPAPPPAACIPTAAGRTVLHHAAVPRDEAQELVQREAVAGPALPCPYCQHRLRQLWTAQGSRPCQAGRHAHCRLKAPRCPKAAPAPAARGAGAGLERRRQCSGSGSGRTSSSSSSSMTSRSSSDSLSIRKSPRARAILVGGQACLGRLGGPRREPLQQLRGG